MNIILKKSILALASLAVFSLTSGAAMADATNPKIGFSIDDLRVERWARDRDFFTAAAEKLGAKVYVQSADASEARQISQIENLIARGVDVIVIVPFNATVLTNTIKEAKKLKVLKPYIDRGDIKIVGQQWVKDWNPTEALSIVENALTANNNKIDAIVASNDGTAGGAIQALAAQKLAGKVPVSGQDADLAAVKRVIAGTQTMTVYKPLKLIASEAATLSVQLARNQKPNFNSQYDNGFKKVDTVLLKPTTLTKANVNLLVEDGFYTQAQL
eukprot:gene23046-24386_t